MSTQCESQCSICLEEIQQTNNCTTPCGHRFCFQCLFQSFRTNTACPLCRNELNATTEEEEEDEDEDNDSNYEEDSDIDEEAEDDDEEDTRVELDKVMTAFESRGYGLKDALSLLISGSMTYDERYTRHYRNKLEDDFEEIFSEIVNEKQEMVAMGQEDRNATPTQYGVFQEDETKTV